MRVTGRLQLVRQEAMNPLHTEVLIVGAGPVGLSLAIELGMRGVSVMVVERNARVGVAPRAKTTNVRTRTHLRRWGIAEKVAAASPLGINYPADVHFVTSLAGFPLAHLSNMANMSPERSPLYPEHAQWIPQYVLEEILLNHAASLPAVDIRFGTSFVGAEHNETIVTCAIDDADIRSRKVIARYLVGADGAGSAVRDLIGARMEGRRGLSTHYNVVFRAPGLDRAHGHGPANMYWQLGPRGVTILAPMDKGDLWAFGTAGVAEGEILSEADAVALIRSTTGIDLPLEVLQIDRWSASDLLADKYQEGNIFLAGDAAHLHPPFGGFGMNMGVADAVDLGWKIAATLQGWGGPALLSSYAAERRPMARLVIDEAMKNYAVAGKVPQFPAELVDDSPEGAAVRARVGAFLMQTRRREFYTLGTVLGLCYSGSPILAAEKGAQPCPHDGETYTPCASPGCLAPHAWLEDGRSLYDLFGEGFTLVVGSGIDEASVTSAQRDAQAIGVPLAVVRLTDQPIAQLYREPLTLIRPDQYVAWRGQAWTGEIFRATGWRTSHDWRTAHGRV